MKRAKQILFGGVVASVAGFGVVACQFSGPIVPTTDCGSYAGAAYWHKEEPAEVTVCLGADEGAAELQFKDSSGAPIPGGGHVSAGGCITTPIPPDADTWDWVKSPQDPGTIHELSIAPWLPTWVSPVGTLHEAVQEYVVGCRPLKANLGDTVRSYAFKVMATSPDEAKAKVSSLAYHGPGTVIPPGVKVGEYIEAEVVGSNLVIRSSLGDRFADFRIEINGELAADLASGLNVEFTNAGPGWITIVTTLPIAALPEPLTFNLRQRAKHDPDEVQAILSF